MKNKMNRMICFVAVICLLMACMCGCQKGGTPEIILETGPAEQTEAQGAFKNFDKENMPKNNSEIKQNIEISDEHIAELIQRVQDCLADESDLWYIAEITDSELLEELNQKAWNGNNQNRKDNFDGEGMKPERNGDGNFMPGGNGNFKSDGDGNKGMPGNGQFAGQGGNMRPGNGRNGFGSCILLVSAMEGAQFSADDVWAIIQEEAEVLGYYALDLELSEEQMELINTQTGYVPSLIVRISTTTLPQNIGGETD